MKTRSSNLGVISTFTAILLIGFGAARLALGKDGCPTFALGESYNVPPPCVTNTNCTAYGLIGTGQNSYPCSDFGDGTFYKSQSLVSGWAKCRWEFGHTYAGPCEEERVACMTVDLYRTELCGVKCNTISMTYCAYAKGVVPIVQNPN